MNYDVEADWQLLNTCGYRCEYCFYPPEVLGEKLKVHADPQVWTDAFDRTGRTWLVHMTGGEPTAYPDFAGLCRLLTKRHFISFNSNLNHRSIVEFADAVNPARVSFINAGLHPAERASRKGLATFLEHARRLRDRGFPIFVSVVCTPEALARFDQIVAMTAPVGLYPVPKLLQGWVRGRAWPQAYAPEERAAFIRFSKRARESSGGGLDFAGARPSIDVFGDDGFLGGVPSFLGAACAAGEKFVKIEPDGKVYRCEPKERNYLGNILDGSFRSGLGATPCDSSYCFYFCLKYANKSAPFPETGEASRSEAFGLHAGNFRLERRIPAAPVIDR